MDIETYLPIFPSELRRELRKLAAPGEVETRQRFLVSRQMELALESVYRTAVREFNNDDLERAEPVTSKPMIAESWEHQFELTPPTSER